MKGGRKTENANNKNEFKGAKTGTSLHADQHNQFNVDV
jgi:hypothetical protein